MTTRLLIAYGTIALMVIGAAILIWRARALSPERIARQRARAYWAEEKAWEERSANADKLSDGEGQRP